MSVGPMLVRTTAAARPRELVTFGAIGGLATAVHFATVSATGPHGLPPLVANIGGFLAAFAVSFAGHGRFSFPPTGKPRPHALRRFAVVAVGAFALNELSYAGLLTWTRMDYHAALLLVLAGVGGLTWGFSKVWAFADV